MNKTPSRFKNPLPVWLPFVVLGGLLALGGMVWLARTARFIRHATQVTGRIVTMGPDEGGTDASIVHYPTFTFSDAAGVVHTLRSSHGGPFNYREGDKVNILYDPADPEDATLDTRRTIWHSPVYLTAFGLCFVGFGTVFGIASRRDSTRARRCNDTL